MNFINIQIPYVLTNKNSCQKCAVCGSTPMHFLNGRYTYIHKHFSQDQKAWWYIYGEINKVRGCVEQFIHNSYSRYKPQNNCGSYNDGNSGDNAKPKHNAIEYANDGNTAVQ